MSLTISFRARRFDPRLGVNSGGPVNVTWPEIVHAAITVGPSRLA